jgi:hypothetical protein
MSVEALEVLIKMAFMNEMATEALNNTIGNVGHN